MAITLLRDMIEHKNPSNLHSSEDNTKRKTLPPSPPSLTNEIINILLLKEFDVGKGSFINAFANHLHSQSLVEAQKVKPIFIISVSFLMAINDNFDEKIIIFGDIHSNENHSDSDQSATQK
ncbi:unnamed protein product, partial [Rotaria sp. Silwood1]